MKVLNTNKYQKVDKQEKDLRNLRISVPTIINSLASRMKLCMDKAYASQ